MCCAKPVQLAGEHLAIPLLGKRGDWPSGFYVLDKMSNRAKVTKVHTKARSVVWSRTLETLANRGIEFAGLTKVTPMQ